MVAHEYYRPFGPLRWIMPRIQLNQWSLVGCLSPEDRCLAIIQEFRQINSPLDSAMLVVNDSIVGNRFFDSRQKMI